MKPPCTESRYNSDGHSDLASLGRAYRVPHWTRVYRVPRRTRGTAYRVERRVPRTAYRVQRGVPRTVSRSKNTHLAIDIIVIYISFLCTTERFPPVTPTSMLSFVLFTEAPMYRKGCLLISLGNTPQLFPIIDSGGKGGGATFCPRRVVRELADMRPSSDGCL